MEQDYQEKEVFKRVNGKRERGRHGKKQKPHSFSIYLGRCLSNRFTVRLKKGQKREEVRSGVPLFTSSFHSHLQLFRNSCQFKIESCAAELCLRCWSDKITAEKFLLPGYVIAVLTSLCKDCKNQQGCG